MSQLKIKYLVSWEGSENARRAKDGSLLPVSTRKAAQAAIDTLVQNLYEALKMPRPEAGYVTIQWAKGSPLMIPLPASNS